MPPQLHDKLQKYFELTAKAIKKAKIPFGVDSKAKAAAEDLLDLSKRYYEDAKYFEKKGDLVNAFGAVVYSHAFLDIGARLNLFDVDDDQLFMIDKK